MVAMRCQNLQLNSCSKKFSDYADLQAEKWQIQAGLVMARANVNEDKERHQSQERSHDRAEEQKEVHKHKLEEKETREKERGRSIWLRHFYAKHKKISL